MDIIFIHGFDLRNKDEFLGIQTQLQKKIDTNKRISKNSVNKIAGVDLSYWDYEGKSFGACSIVVLEYHTKKVIEKVFSSGKIEVPYVPGFLAFRELPLVIEAARKLVNVPDVFLFDGNGYLHYNHMGIATHASFFLDKPTIGIAKSYLKIQNHDFEMPANVAGAYTDIVIENEVYGRALRTAKNVKPIFLSCGNYIDLESSYDITMDLINQESKLPIPVRLADLETHLLRKKLMK